MASGGNDRLDDVFAKTTISLDSEKSLDWKQPTNQDAVTFDDIEQLSIRIAEHALEING